MKMERELITLSEEEKKATHFANVEDLISNCNNWIYEEDRDAFYRWFDFGAMEDLINLIEKQNKRIDELEKELEPIRELNIPVKTAVAELNRLEDIEDDREQMKIIIYELRKENKDLIADNYRLDRENQLKFEEIVAESVPKAVIREYKDKFIEDSKNETVFMTQSCQINASLISFCKELLGEIDAKD